MSQEMSDPQDLAELFAVERDGGGDLCYRLGLEEMCPWKLLKSRHRRGEILSDFPRFPQVACCANI